MRSNAINCEFENVHAFHTVRSHLLLYNRQHSINLGAHKSQCFFSCLTITLRMCKIESGVQRWVDNCSSILLKTHMYLNCIFWCMEFSLLTRVLFRSAFNSAISSSRSNSVSLACVSSFVSVENSY